MTQSNQAVQQANSLWAGDTYVVSPSGLVSNPPPGSYAFRNRINIMSNNRFNYDTPTQVISPAGGEDHIVVTAALPNKTIKQCTSLNLWGSPYPSFDVALAAGRKWRQIAMSVFSRLATGCEFGDDDDDNLQPRDVDERHYRGMFGLTMDDRVYWDRTGLFVFSASPQPHFINLTVDAYGLSGLSDLPSLIAGAENRYTGVWSDDLLLAYQLVHAGLSETRNPASRHVLTVTAIEALIPYRERYPELSQLLDELQPVAAGMSHYDEDTRAAVKKLLDSDKMDSVRRYGIKLTHRVAGKYGGMSSKKYFDHVYGLRSDLAHGNPRDSEALTDDALNKEFLELLRFVLDILESWTESPGFDSEEDQSPNSTKS